MYTPKRRRRVYVIDEDKSARESLAGFLRSENYNVQTFSSPQGLFNGPLQNQNACIVLDIESLPAGELTLQLMQLKLPRIVLSATDNFTLRRHARELRARAFFLKPIDGHVLVDAISWAIEGS